jgi:uncharacterized protein
MYHRDMNDALLGHVQQQLANANAWVKSLTTDFGGQPLPSRHVFAKTRQYTDDFMSGRSARRWVIIPGLRGVGKTTLLAQQFKYVTDRYEDQADILHLSLHDVVNVMGGSLYEAVRHYEEILGHSVEHHTKPIFLFLDEVQEDPKWAEVLFSLHERSRRLFIYCSGSSATHLRTDANIVRRAYIEPLYPLNYTEYQMLRFNIMPEAGLKASLKEAAFGSRDVSMALSEITKLLPLVRRYRAKINASTFSHFMYTGSLPFLVNETNQAQVYTNIISLIDRIINEDLAKGHNFDSTTLGMVKQLLFLLADADVVSRANLATALGLDSRVVGSLLEALVKTEMLIEVPARGSVSTAVSRPKKYLFMSPAIRATLHQIAGVAATDATRKGKLLEDLVGLYFYREFVIKRLADFTHNYGEGHADFMLQTASGMRIPVEVGMGNKGSRQVVTTMKDVQCSYGVVISSSELGIDNANNILYIPLSLFYLM